MSDDADHTHEHVRQLTEPYRHAEPYLTHDDASVRQVLHTHRRTYPALLDQLREAWRSTVGDDAGSGIATSKPPMTLGPLDTLTRIRAASADWVSRGLRLKLRPTIEGNIRLLGSRVPEHGDDLAHEIRRWWRWARVEAAWDGRPRTLRDPCPHCGERMLRVAWDVSAAWCAGCGETWGPYQLGILGSMITQQRGNDGNQRDMTQT